MNEKIETSQRIQQLKKGFWQIFQSNKYCPIYKEWEKFISRSGYEQQQVLKRHFKIWRKSFCNDKYTTLFFLERNIEEISAGRMQVTAPDMQGWYERIQQDAQSELHRVICKDVIDFLSSKHGDRWLYRCFVVAWADAVHQCQQGQGGIMPPDAFNLSNLHHQMQLKHSQITYQLALMIATSAWTQKLGNSPSSGVRQKITAGAASYRPVGFAPRA